MIDQDGEKFIYSNSKNVKHLLDLKQEKKLTLTQIGLFFQIAQFIEEKSNLLINPLNHNPLNRNQLATLIHERKTNLNKQFQVLIDNGLIIASKFNGKDVYFANVNYVFNAPKPFYTRYIVDDETLHLSNGRDPDNKYYCNGEVKSLNNYLRWVTFDWRNKVLNKYNFTCDVSGEVGGKLNVHHLKSFNHAVKNALKKSGIECKEFDEYTDEDLKKIKDQFLIEHGGEENGVCLSQRIHKMFHQFYGRDNNTPEQYYDFKRRCASGEILI